jgi:hypothetical protein
MNIKAIIASLVLGSSSLAMAAPGVRDHRAIDDNCEPPAYGQPVYNQPTYGQPVYNQPTYGQPVYGQPVYNQPVYGQPVAQPVYSQPAQPIYQPAWRPGWQPQAVMLASGLGFGNFDRTAITVGRHAGQFDALQITGTGGRSLIKLINIVFADGTHQTVRNVNQTLVGNQSMTINLDGEHRAIRDITIYGDDISNGWRRGGSSFSVTAL